MLRRLFTTHFVLALSLWASSCCAQTIDKLADGSYSSGKSPAPGAVSQHWEMTKVPDGGFLVTSTWVGGPAKLSNAIQELAFTEDWKPTSYSIKMAPADAPQKSISLKCQYLPNAISCNSVINGVSSKGSFPVTGPHVFFPMAFIMDISWIMASVCSQAERSPGKVTNVAEIGMKMQNDPDPSVTALEVAETVPVLYVGREELKTALGKTFAHKFQSQDMTVWTADSGLVLAMTVEGSDEGERLELTSLNDTTNKLLTPHFQK